MEVQLIEYGTNNVEVIEETETVYIVDFDQAEGNVPLNLITSPGDVFVGTAAGMVGVIHKGSIGQAIGINPDGDVDYITVAASGGADILQTQIYG